MTSKNGLFLIMVEIVSDYKMSYAHNANKTVWTVTTSNTLEQIKNCLDHYLTGVTLVDNVLYVGTQTHINMPNAITIKQLDNGKIKIVSKYGYMAGLMTDYGPDGLPTTPYIVLSAALTPLVYPAMDILPTV